MNRTTPITPIPTTPEVPVTTTVVSPKAPKATTPAAPISISAARKRRKLTGDEYRSARDFARKTVGYDDSSPIWGKRMPVVLGEIETAIDAGDTATARALVKELQKRIAAGAIIGAQR